MSDDALRDLATAAGLDTSWIDFDGVRHVVSLETLRAVLTALGLFHGNGADIEDSLARLSAEQAHQSHFRVGKSSETIRLDSNARVARLELDDGSVRDVTIAGDGTVVLPLEPGYHTLSVGDRVISLAVAPRKCWRIEDGVGDRRLFGLAAQVYSLRGGHTAGFGDFAALADLTKAAAREGSAAIAVSPVHALFGADPGRSSPYSPSTRLFLNGLYGDTTGYAPPLVADDASSLIDWASAGPRKLEQLRAAYETFRQTRQGLDAFNAFVERGGEALLSHARFEALDARFRPQNYYHWRSWPVPWNDSSSAEVAGLSLSDPTVEFHLFVQYLADRSLGAAQRAARDAGMPIGLIADLAIGMDGAGSHAWSRPSDVLSNISVGAPPDPLGPDGQNWGLTTFSPRGLVQTNFAPFLQTLRAAMQHAGGVRIDHVMGMQRLWVIPEGAGAMDGLYLNYPLVDLLALTALESWRHKAIVIGEDLGTVAPGFRERLADTGILGMRVLWFERGDGDAFKLPAAWPTEAVAMTTTHDLPTIAGWTEGREIAWREQIDGNRERAEHARRDRDTDRQRLDHAFSQTGFVPEENLEPARTVEAAMNYVGLTPCRLAIVPMEDVLAEVEQPNLPGTIDEHPNWRRRLSTAEPFDEPSVMERLAVLKRARETS